VSGQRLARQDPAGPFLGLYDRALPQVYGYLLARGFRFSLGQFPG
jgi:hypothetical protein